MSENNDSRAKVCTKCGGSGGFYRDRRAPDGLRTECKACDKKKALRWRYKNHERALATELQRQQRPEVKAKRREQQRAARLRNPEQAKARDIFKNAIKSGRIVRQPCRLCGNPKGQGHHLDYAKPLEVDWLCARCHGKQHRTSHEGRKAAQR